MTEPHPIANDYLMDLIVEKLSSKVIFYKNGKPKKKPGLTRDEIYGCFEQFRKVEESTYNSAKESSDKVLDDFVEKIKLKHGEMVSLMRRNKMKIDNLDDPMQKLAFTFFCEIGEMSHEAEVLLEELRTKERE